MPSADCLDVLRDLRDALSAAVEEIDDAKLERAAFGQESRDAHAATAAAVARAEGKVDALGIALTSSRVETAGAVGAAQAAVGALQEEVRSTRRLVYVVVGGGSGLFALVLVALLVAVLTLRGLDGAGIVKQSADTARNLTPSSAATTGPNLGTTTEGAASP